MFYRGNKSRPALRKALATAVALWLYAAIASAQNLSSSNPGGHSTAPAATGRLYIFRPIRSFGADIDDYVTVNGLKVQRIDAGTGFYCDVTPGVYLLGVFRHEGPILKVSVAPGQRIYILVDLHHLGGVAPRAGTLTPDQSFDDWVLEPSFGAQRVREYHLTRAQCQP
jgi:hypothetical protein